MIAALDKKITVEEADGADVCTAWITSGPTSQVFDLAGEAPILVTGVQGDQLGMRRMQYLAVNSDGIPLIIGGDQLTGLRWQC